MSKKRRDRFYYIWSATIVICLILVLFALVFVSCQGGIPPDEPSSSPTGTTDDPADSTVSPAAATAGTPSGTQAPSGTVAPVSTVLQETEDMGQEYIDKFIFLGDSTTYGLDYYNIVNNNQVWTPADRTFSLFNQSHIRVYYPETGEELTIEEILDRKKPEYMLITLGINGISQMDEDYFKSEYEALVGRIQAASPDTKIIINSIYPVAQSYKYLGDINNIKIEEANRWLVDIAENTGTRFLNSNSVLINEYSALPEEYQNGDGMHLTGEAFGIVMNYIRTHGYK